MRLVVAAVGKVKEPHLRRTLDDYYGRIRRYASIEEVELREDAGRDSSSALLRRIPEGAHLVAMDVAGRQLSSEEFAKFVDHWCSRDKGIVAFALGGSDGLTDTVLSASRARLSLSRMTLPHRLARIFLAEQLYRAMTILRGEPYAR